MDSPSRLGSPPPERTAWVFAATLFVSAFLLFLIEPIAARMILPTLGGAPMVWNGCVLVFQCLLLVGYAAAHGGRRWLGPRRFSALYVALLPLPLLSLPIRIAMTGSAPDRHPLAWLVVALLESVAAPFLVLAMSTSALQASFAETSIPGSQDPYALYVASNAGSLLGLLAYPLLVEPMLTLRNQGRIWAAGYGAFVLLALVCVVTAARLSPRTDTPAVAPPVRLPLRRRARWVALAAIPSSLLLGVTGYLTTDIASFPLLWVLPMALYLSTFMLGFARPSYWRRVSARRLPLGVVAVIVSIVLNIGAPEWLIVPIHLGTFMLAALLCHSSLADDRPPASHLTEFYLWMAVGGAIGGLFNMLIAPLVFSSIAEYPLALLLAVLMRPNGDGDARRAGVSLGDLLVPASVAALTIGAIVVLHRIGQSPKPAFYLPALLCLSQLRHVKRFAAAVAVLVVVGSVTPYVTVYGHVLEVKRTFFGVYRISADPSGLYYSLYHGTTLHGLETMDRRRANEPLTYYDQTGPFGQAFAGLPHVRTANDIAVVGLGIGALATYSAPTQHWTFYEIDPAVEQIARDTRYFTQLEACGARCTVVVGDARLSLARSRPGQFGLLVLDAFSSDAIPVHLMTREALALYVSRLEPDGVLAFHISNRHLTLGPVLARLAGAERLTALEQAVWRGPDIDDRGRTTSDWMVMARRREDLGSLAEDGRWSAPRVQPATPLWTDDFSNILSVLNLGD